MTEHASARAFSTPWDAPLVPTFPFRFNNVEIVTAIYRSDLDRITSLLPPPLEAASDRVAIHVYKMNDTEWLGVYNESAVQLDVRLGGTDVRGAYSPYLFLDSDGAIAAGREMYGQPKKFGRPSIEARQDLVVATVERNGIDVLTITTPYKQRRAHIQDALGMFDFITNINLKVVPNIDATDAIRQLTARELSDITVYECWVAEGTVELRPNAQAPVYRLPVAETLATYHWRCDFTLDLGRVLYDYIRPANDEAI